MAAPYKAAFLFSFFLPGNPVGEGDFFFDLDTFIFFNNNIRETPLAAFEKKRYIFDFAKVGQLTSAKLKQLVKCMLKSKSVPVKLKTLIETFKETL